MVRPCRCRPATPHLVTALKRLDYGMDEVIRRFLDGVDTGADPRGVGLTDALEVLRLQQAPADRARAQTPA